ncbi:hypothetical protein AUP68_05575 [Ilyonectria robusta]
MAIPCTICGRTFNNYYSLRLHLDSDAHATLTWNCERVCGRVFTTPEALAYHQSVAPLHHILDRYVQGTPDYEEEFLCCQDCDRDFDNIHALYQHLRYNSRHRMTEEQLLPYGYGERPSFRSVAESLTRLRLEEEQEQRERQHLVQDEHSSSHAVQPVEQASTHSSFTSSFESRSSTLQNLPNPHSSTASGSNFVVQAGLSSPTPDVETNVPVDTGPDHLSPWVQNLTLNDPPATSQTVDASTRQGPVGSEAVSRSTSSFFPRAPATLAHPPQSSQSIRSLFDNDPITAAHFAFKVEKNKPFEHRKTVIHASPAERMARPPAKQCVPTLQEELGILQEELVAMATKIAVMESELQAAKDALKYQESQRQCVMCFERDFDSVTKCGHQFCGVCIDSWQSQHRSPWQTPCPICRKAMGKAIRVYNESSV